MAARLLNVTTGNAYTDANALAAPGARRVNFQVANKAIRYQLGRGWPGVVWGEETFLLPGFHSFDRACTGVRVRSGATGQPAQVTVDLLDVDDLPGGG